MRDRKKVFILLGHSDKKTLSGILASNYEKGARAGGHKVRRMNLGDLKFDPILHEGYKVIQKLEPDLCKVQENMKWADHIVIFYPNWWGSMPALLKGMFDRLFLPGFAFRFKKNGFGWEKLLTGKSAMVNITMNTHPWLAWLLFGDNSNEIKCNILEFAGIEPVNLVKMGPVEKMSDEEHEGLKRRMYRLGKSAK